MSSYKIKRILLKIRFDSVCEDISLIKSNKRLSPSQIGARLRPLVERRNELERAIKELDVIITERGGYE